MDTHSTLAPWWDETSEDELGRVVFGLVESLWESDEARRAEIEENYRRFSGKGIKGGFAASPEEALKRAKRPLRLNVVKSVVETIVAKVGKNRPRPTLLTDGADHSLQRKVRDLQKFVDGAYMQADIYALVPLIFRDAMIAGTGFVHWYGKRVEGTGRICAERVLPTEILVDERDAVAGDPQSAYRVKHVDKFVAMKLWPKHKVGILNAPSVKFEDVPDYERPAPQLGGNLIRLCEAWHLACYDSEGALVPGKHVVTAGNEVVVNEPWNYDYYPFERFHWTAPTTGYYGQPAVTEVLPVDSEVNTILQQVQAAMKLTANPWVLVQKNSKVKAGKLTNKTGQIVEYDGSVPPQIVSFQPIHPQVIQHLWGLFAKAYEILGSNEMAASAVKPPGVDSGRALEQLSEEHLVRFETQSRHLEDVVGVRCARQALRVAKDLHECLPNGFTLRSVVGKTALKIEWSKVEMSPLDFFVQCWPTSILPATPAGRTEEVERWQANQWIDAPTAQKLLDFPDLDRESNLMLADENLLDQQIDDMLYGEEDADNPTLPDPRQNLEKAATRATYALLKGTHDKIPDAHLRRIRRYLDAIDEINAAAAPPPPPEMLMASPEGGMGPGAQPPMGAPPAPPGMPPMPGGMPPMGM